MPILQHSQTHLPPIAPPPYDSKRKHKEVWNLRSTNEIFTDYESYIERLMQYRLPQWQCERTGRADLTYDQAMESENAQNSRAEYRFSFGLAKRIFQCVQFNTGRLDAAVDHAYDSLCDDYEAGEYINCLWDDGIAYNARILEIVPAATSTTVSTNGTHHLNASSHVSETAESDDDHKEQPATTTLKFPDAFLLPEPKAEETLPRQETIESYFKQEESSPPMETYRVQLVDADGDGIEECIKPVTKGDIRRDRFYFSKPLIKRLIRECMMKENYIGAPWLVKPSIADHYGIDTTLPYHLKNARDVAYSKSRKRKLASDTEGERKAPMDASQREKLKEEKERIREERRQQAAIKYPVDDIDLPIYRKDPINSWQLVDMTLTSNNELPSPIPYPSGGRPLRPVPWKEFSVPAEYFEPYIMTWIFLSTFAEPLGLDPFTIDDFEAGLCQTTSKSLIIIESYSALLNAIVRERKDGVLPGCIAGGPTTTSPISSRSATPNRTSNSIKSEKMQIDETLDESDKPDNASENGKPHDNENALSPATSTSEPSALERGQGSTDVNKVSKNWDNREIRSDRRGWEATLIGCLNELATPNMIPALDEILNHLVPRTNCTIADREKAFMSLDITYKIQILEFLVNVVNECSLIKEYMEQCQDQLTELRRQKIDLNRENKRILASKMALIEKDKEEHGEKEDNDESGDNADESEASDDGEGSQQMSEDEESSDDNTSDSDGEPNEDTTDNDGRSSRRARHDKRHQSRQAKLKRRQEKRQELEAQRAQNYRQEREKAKIRNQQARAKAEERKQLEDDEKAQQEKEGQIEKNMRRYMTLRIRPLGRDRFYNRYFYLDNIGGAEVDGTGRLYIQNPSYADMRLLLQRKANEVTGPGSETTRFLLELMKQQGFNEESEWLEQRLREISSEGDIAGVTISTAKSWWMYYSQPEEIDALLLWLNPKGVREQRLRNEINKQYNSIVQGMKNHKEAQDKDHSKPSRPRTRFGGST